MAGWVACADLQIGASNPALMIDIELMLGRRPDGLAANVRVIPRELSGHPRYLIYFTKQHFKNRSWLTVHISKLAGNDL